MNELSFVILFLFAIVKTEEKDRCEFQKYLKVTAVWKEAILVLYFIAFHIFTPISHKNFAAVLKAFSW